jgi:voltage-gated potassium channel
MAVVDLLALVPTMLAIEGLDLRSLRVLRILRMLTILRLGRYSTGMQLMARVLWTRRGELGALLLIVVVVLLCAATVMYYLECEAQPEVFASIPHSLWWAIITLTTVGYGDAAPITVAGKLVGGLVALLGVGVVAMPAGILASGLNDELARVRERREQPRG